MLSHVGATDAKRWKGRSRAGNGLTVRTLHPGLIETVRRHDALRHQAGETTGKRRR